MRERTSCYEGLNLKISPNVPQGGPVSFRKRPDPSRQQRSDDRCCKRCDQAIEWDSEH